MVFFTKPPPKLFSRSPAKVSELWEVLEANYVLPSFNEATFRLSPSGYVLYAGYSDSGFTVGFGINKQLDALMLKSAVGALHNEKEKVSVGSGEYLKSSLTLSASVENLMVGFMYDSSVLPRPYTLTKSLKVTSPKKETQKLCDSLYEKLSLFMKYEKENVDVKFDKIKLRKIVQCLDLTYTGLNADNTLSDFVKDFNDEYQVRQQWCWDVFNCPFDDVKDVRRYARFLLKGVDKNFIVDMWDYPDSWVERAGSGEVDIYPSSARRYISRHAK